MSDYIKREDMRKKIDNEVPTSEWRIFLRELLDGVPSADVVEVVRCKDCIRRNIKCGIGEHKWCDFLNMSTEPNDFCSYGER